MCDKKAYTLNLKKETQHFIFYYTEFDNPCINKISEVLENSYDKITDNLNQKLEEKLVIEIIRTLINCILRWGFQTHQVG